MIVPIACLIIPGGSKVLVKSGETDLPMIANEYLFTAVLTAVFGCVLFGLIPLLNKERVPYTAGDKISFKDMMGALKSNKPFMLVIISYFLGFGRQMAMGIQVQAANILLGSQNLVAVLGISTAIGTMISMAACPFLIKKLDEKKVFIGLSVYGFIASVLSFVIAHFWFTNPDNMVLTILFYFSLFLMGLQFASVNLMPMIMTADCVDYYEYETGKRMEGTAYSVLTLTIKICLALGTALGLVFVQVSGYSDTVREIAAGTAAGFATKTKDIVFFAYAVVPGILSLLSAIPIFKYDIVGKKKQEISDALQARRTAAAVVTTATHNRTSLRFSKTYYEKRKEVLQIANQTTIPPETEISCPVIYLFSARKSTVSATSSGVPSLSSGVSSASSALSKAAFIRVSIIPGETLFTVIPLGASSLASAFVKPIIPALLIE